MSPFGVHEISNGLPGPTTIDVDVVYADFSCGSAGCGATPFDCSDADDTIFVGGEKTCYEVTLELDMQGTDSLSGFTKTLSLPAFIEIHTDAHPLGPVQVFDAEITSLFSSLVGDPDFSIMVLAVGRNHGLPPSTGVVTLTQTPGGAFNVESFFDVTYQLTTYGDPSGPLASLLGATMGTVQMVAGQPPMPGCNPLSTIEVSRVGSPPNPDAFQPGATSGPVIGATWDPVIDHTTFVTDSVTDFAVITGGSINLPLGPPGTLLCNVTAPPLILVSAPAPGLPFALPVPDDCGIVGLSLCAQGGSIDSGFAPHLANALDFTFGTY